jgi:hypothetical protein
MTVLLCGRRITVGKDMWNNIEIVEFGALKIEFRKIIIF